jgi:hypothetical protein
MEDTLGIYEKPYDPGQPVVCLDEKPISLHDDVRPPIPAQPGKPAKQDNEYARCGVANVFGVVEPKTGRHFTTATPNRSGAEFARIVGHVVEQYPAASTIHLVMDNLNIHTRKSLTDLLRRAEGWRHLGPAHCALHSKTRKLAQSSGNRTQSVRAAMSGQTADSRSAEVAARNQGLEPSGQPEADEDQLAVHAQESPKGIQVQTAPPPPLT